MMSIKSTRRGFLKGIFAVASIAAVGGVSGIFKDDIYYMTDGETLKGLTFDDYSKIVLADDCTITNCTMKNCTIEGKGVKRAVITYCTFSNLTGAAITFMD